MKYSQKTSQSDMVGAGDAPPLELEPRLERLLVHSEVSLQSAAGTADLETRWLPSNTCLAASSFSPRPDFEVIDLAVRSHAHVVRFFAGEDAVHAWCCGEKLRTPPNPASCDVNGDFHYHHLHSIEIATSQKCSVPLLLSGLFLHFAGTGELVPKPRVSFCQRLEF